MLLINAKNAGDMKCRVLLLCVCVYVCMSRDDSEAVERISEILPKMHSIVIGPGLGRDDKLLTVVKVSNSKWT